MQSNVTLYRSRNCWIYRRIECDFGTMQNREERKKHAQQADVCDFEIPEKIVRRVRESRDVTFTPMTVHKQVLLNSIHYIRSILTRRSWNFLTWNGEYLRHRRQSGQVYELERKHCTNRKNHHDAYTFEISHDVTARQSFFARLARPCFTILRVS